MRSATVVLPVPGLPVKLMCSDGAPAASCMSRRTLSTTSSEAISRMRFLTGARPISSRIELVEHGLYAGLVPDRSEIDGRLAHATASRSLRSP